MNTLKPSMCISKGPLTVCHCTEANVKQEQRNCLAYSEKEKGYCTYYRFSIGACSNYDGCFSIKED